MKKRVLDAEITNFVASCTLMLEMGKQIFFQRVQKRIIS